MFPKLSCTASVVPPVPGKTESFCAPDEEQDLRAIEKLTRIRIPEGDLSIYEKLPPPQKETAESEMRNARGRMNRGEAQARAEKSREKKPARGLTPKKDERRAEQKHTDPRLREGDARPENGMPRHKHRRNRPGSRARKRMRENGGYSTTL